MLSFDHNGVISMDVTFGTNNVKFHLFTMMVFNAYHIGMLEVWIIKSRQTCEDLVKWLIPISIKHAQVETLLLHH